MQRTVTALRILWYALMAILLVLIMTGQIGGFAVIMYGMVTLAVIGIELALRRRIKT